MSASDVQIQIIGKDLASAAFRQVDAAAQRTESQMALLGGSAGRMGGMFRNALSVTAGIAGFEGMSQIMNRSVGAALEFNKNLEGSAVGMAGILMSMGQVDGRSLTWGESLSVASGVISRLNDESLKTAASVQELTGAFQALLGPGMASGMSIKQLETLSVTGVNAVKSLQLPAAQVVQELRDLVAGGIQPASSTLATALGLKDSDIAAAKVSSEGLFKFLTDRLKGFEIAAVEQTKTWGGLVDIARKALTRAGGEGTLPIFEYTKEEMKKLNSQLLSIDETTKNVSINPALVSGIRDASQNAVAFAEQMKGVGSTVGTVAVPAVQLLGSALGIVARNAESVTYALGAWLVMKQVQTVYLDIMNVSAGAASAQTALGRVIQESNVQLARQAAIVAEGSALQRTALLDQINSIKAAMAADAARAKGTFASLAGSTAYNASIVKANKDLVAAAAAAESGQIGLAKSILASNELLAAQGKIAVATAEKQAIAAAAASKAQTYAGLSSWSSAGSSLLPGALEAGAVGAGMSLGARVSLGAGMLGRAAWAGIGGWFGFAVIASYIAYEEIMFNKAKIEELNKVKSTFTFDNNGNPQNTDIDWREAWGNNVGDPNRSKKDFRDPLLDSQGPLTQTASPNVTGKYFKQNEEVIRSAQDLHAAILLLEGKTLEAQLAHIEKERAEWIKKTQDEVSATQWAELAKQKAMQDQKDATTNLYTETIKLQGYALAAQLIQIENEKKAWEKKTQDRVAAEKWAAAATVKANEEAAERTKSAYEKVQSAREGVGSAFQGAFGSAINEVMDNIRNNRSEEAYDAVQKMRAEVVLRNRATQAVAGAAGYGDSISNPLSPWGAVNKAAEQLIKAQEEQRKVLDQQIKVQTEHLKATVEGDNQKMSILIAIAQNTAQNGGGGGGGGGSTPGGNGGQGGGYNQPQYGIVDAKGRITPIVNNTTFSPTINVGVNGMDAESRQQVGEEVAGQLIPTIERIIGGLSTRYGGPT